MSESWFLDDDQLVHELRCAGGASAVPELRGYTDLAELARGGQGIVYTGRQSATGRLVAIKVLPARPSGGREARFDRELELLARLSHRNVVGIVDSGSTGDGRPFLVMELVDGPTIDRCDAVTAWAQDPADAAARDRLVELVAQVCDGVASAHRRGIVHRDLKPSNVRIDHDGTPKVLDFGLAKDLGGPLDDLTRGGASAGAVFLGTLEWCSPEQARGEVDDVDTRADVWGLGMILYRLLAGTMPFPRESGLHAALNAIVERPAPPLRGHRATIPPDLETIVHHCLEKRADDRYQTAGELALDLRAFLAGQPIAVRRHSTWYVLRKTAARHRGTVAFAGLLLLSLLAGLSLALVLWVRAEDGRVRAETAERRARTALDFFADALRAASPNRQGPEAKVIDLLRQTDRSIDTNLAGEADAQHFLLTRLADVYASLSQLDDAERTAKAALVQAQRAHGSDHAITFAAHAALAHIWHQQGRYRDVVDTLTPLASRAESLGLARDNVVGNLFMVLGLGHLRLGELDAAERAFQIAAAVPLADEGEQQVQAASRENLAAVARARGDLKTAVQFLHEVVALRTAQAGPEHSATLDSIANLAFYEAEAGDVVGAEQRLAHALEIARPRLGPRAITTLQLLSNQAQYLHRLRQLDRALPIAEECVVGRTAVLGADHPHTLVSRNNLAMIRLDRGDIDGAIAELEGIVAVRRAQRDVAPLDVLGPRNNIARAKKQAGRLGDAIGDLAGVLADTERQLGEGHWLAKACRATLGLWLHTAKRDAEALPLLQRAVADLTADKGPDHADTAAVRRGLHEVLRALGRGDEVPVDGK